MKNNIKNIILIAGSIISFCIGSGFATGQEIMQFFTSYGLSGIIGGVLTTVLYIYVCMSFIHVGKKNKFKRANDIFRYYAGNTFGTFFDWYTVVLLFLIYIVMLSGTGAIFEEYWHLPAIAGRAIMALITTVSVVFGFKKLTDILGLLGPIIIIGCLSVACIALFTNFEGLTTVSAFLESGGGDGMLKAADNWLISAILYATYLALPLGAFVGTLGAQSDSLKIAHKGAFAGAAAFGVAAVAIVLSQLANLPEIANSSIPLLYLATKMLPALGGAFSVVLVGGIFSTAAPTLWQVSARFAEDKSKKFVIITIVCVAVAFAASFTPFRTIVNIVYPTSGWLGIVFLIMMIVKQLRTLATSKNSAAAKAGAAD